MKIELILFLLFWINLTRVFAGPHFYIGGRQNPYIRRWWIIPRNSLFNIYFHEILRDDDDRALHDHPWWSISILLKGSLAESDEDGYHSYDRWKIRIRSAQYAHRLILPYWRWYSLPDDPIKQPAYTLFITGPRIREWGFLCPQGWRHWKEFTSSNGEEVGRGCDLKEL